VEGSAPEELEARLAELEQQRADGSISEIGFNLRRNLLITRSEQLARRRLAASHSAPPPPPAPPARRRARRGWLLATDQPPAGARPSPPFEPVSAPARQPEPDSPPPQQAAQTPSSPLAQPGVAPPASRHQPRNGPAPALPVDEPAVAPESSPPPVAHESWAPPVAPESSPPPVTPGSSPPPEPADRTPRHRVRAAAPWVVAVAVAAGVALVAYHLGTGGATDPSTGATFEAAPPSSTPTSSPSPSAVAGTALGQTKTTSDGGSITLVTYDSNLLSIAGAAPPTATGESFTAVELRVCAGSAAPTSVTPFDFVLVEPGGTLVDILNGIGEGQQPALQNSEVPPGRCVSGWLSYEVTATPATFTDTADGLTWAVG
jgi:hypothetical protein